MTHGFPEALKTFRWVAETVPAYQSFLRSHGVDLEAIQSVEDFASLPPMTKAGYLKSFPYLELFPNKQLPSMVSSSSGSSGRPFFWPRGDEHDAEGGMIHEKIFRDIFGIEGKRTLVIVSFSMGSWVAGTYTMSSARWVAAQGHDVTTITPGIDIEDGLNALRYFAPQFEKVIIAGYPPLVMDLVVAAKEAGIGFDQFDTRFLLAGENFTESWRAALCDHVGVENTPDRSVTIYGTADATILGHETPETIAIRQWLHEHTDAIERIDAGLSSVPSIVQYDPTQRYFEVDESDELLFTAKSGLPLIRYQIGDRGMLTTVSELAAQVGMDTSSLSDAPVIVLFGRDDVVVSFYALNIYPEHIRAGLETDSIASSVSGKFVAEVEFENNHADQRFVLHVELSSESEPSEDLAARIQESVVETLRAMNAEYRKLYEAIGERARPHIVLHTHGEDTFQIRGSKHRWVR